MFPPINRLEILTSRNHNDFEIEHNLALYSENHSLRH